ncbi:hypothetical protein DID88_002654 [Monilinia fructigena]|uniref:Uncharacterized protein n=1 Tax=Monilinia fructigena TaxID=38457 RepID=A0A395IPF0_9HELO|nr:hypothetical protein DID88_002654 [Monilinia fructigena]
MHVHPRVAVAGNRLSREWVYVGLTWGEDEFEDDENDEDDEDDEDNENDKNGQNSGYENYDECDEFEDMEEDAADNIVIEAVFNSVNVMNGGENWQVTYYSYQMQC